MTNHTFQRISIATLWIRNWTSQWKDFLKNASHWSKSAHDKKKKKIFAGLLNWIPLLIHKTLASIVTGEPPPLFSFFFSFGHTIHLHFWWKPAGWLLYRAANSTQAAYLLPAHLFSLCRFSAPQLYSTIQKRGEREPLGREREHERGKKGDGRSWEVGVGLGGGGAGGCRLHSDSDGELWHLPQRRLCLALLSTSAAPAHSFPHPSVAVGCFASW